MNLTNYMLKLADEMHAASAYICEHGAIKIGTPQSRRLIETVQLGRQLGVIPNIPTDYPMDTHGVKVGEGRIGSRTAADFSSVMATMRELNVVPAVPVEVQQRA